MVIQVKKFVDNNSSSYTSCYHIPVEKDVLGREEFAKNVPFYIFARHYPAVTPMGANKGTQVTYLLPEHLFTE